jgi:hypothetical protein
MKLVRDHDTAGWAFTVQNDYAGGNDTCLVEMAYSGNDLNSGIGVTMDTAVSGEYLLNLASGGSSRFRVTGDGNVGINKTSPAKKLHVYEASSYTAPVYLEAPHAIVQMVGSPGTAYMGMGDGYLTGAGSGFFIRTDNKDINFGTAQSSRTDLRIHVADGEVDVAGRFTVGHNNTVTSVSGANNDALITVGATFVGVAAQTLKLNGMYVNNGFTTGAAISNINQVAINTPGITETGGACTTASSLYIEGAPSAATNNYALFCDGGNSRFDGYISVGGDFKGGLGSGDNYPLSVTYNGNTHQGASWFDQYTSTGTKHAIWFKRYYNSSWTAVGRISTTENATVYTTSSDYRLKENETPFGDALNLLGQLKPYKFNFKIRPDKIVQGFFAHEVAEIVPQAVAGEKDEVDDVGEAVMQSVDHSHMVPLLVAAVQELTDKVETLEAKVAVLESA